ncbi:energy transducer TonB [Thalassotalea piscium]
MMLLKRLTTFGVLSALCSTSVFAEQSVKHISSYKEPVPLKRIEPKYPISAAKEGREGWTKMSFIVEEDGSVSNVMVIDSSGSKDFNKTALKAVKQWKYSPAIENGKPIQQCINTLKMSFSMRDNGAKGVTRRFRTKYLAAIDALEQKDYKKTEQLIEKLTKNSKMHLTEANLYHILIADYAKSIANETLEIQHLKLVSTNTSSLSPQNAYNILTRIFFLEIKKNQLYNAVNTYEKIKKLDVAKPYIEHFDKMMNQIDDLINSDQPITVKANLKNKNFWFYQLVRNKFSITNIKGNLNKIDVRCANKHHIYTMADDHTWAIPDDWKHCSLMIFGDEQSSFSLIEQS